MTKILFFDTETTGLSPGVSAPLESQPRIVQIGYIVAEFEGFNYSEISRGDLLFHPGMSIPEGASSVHGITDDIVADKPSFRTFWSEFVRLTNDADIICWHNVSYDIDVLFWEMDRMSSDSERRQAWKERVRKKAIDTMLVGTDICKIPGRMGYKWPKLMELHTHLFWKGFNSAHNAMGDIEATMRCFIELLKLCKITI